MTDTATHKPPQTEIETSGKVRVWDPLVRVFHWSLVAAFATAWLTADEVQPLHEIAGYTVAGLIAFRLIWGFVGGRYARFAQFLKGPGATLAYLRDMAGRSEQRHLGHNPAGAAMILALLITLSGTAFTGWLIAEPDRVAMLPDATWIVPPARADGDRDAHEYGARDEIDGPLKEVHETLANLMLLLAALHVGGVVLASVRHRENLARAMVTGHKRTPGPDDIC
ncbi:cytochrome b/b6 domain-containing protein [Sinisalibacter aestuarii]|uniref:Cytochrome b561 n=1 Tax=Sinisalibacter aestuarii TaxID=2949426 RepID=A0ABQ5LYB4_9RHOB|nr:cytochrome b/b6 domain-containing protein [Sinisalibacter aestuarii]GKY89919.1 cytochrome b561 [Sinisalibacter aestuarii]